MSTTATIPPAGSPGRGPSAVGAYVDAVRRQLDDLTGEEIEELTGGLEADLTDALDGRDVSPAQHFGEPSDYAAELRAAAGLAPRAAGGDRRAVQSVLTVVRTQWHHDLARLRRQPWWPELVTHLISLRPAWWVLRGVAAVALLAAFLGLSVTLLVFILAVIAAGVSLAIGRRTLAGTHGIRRVLLAAGNTIAVLTVAVFTVAVLDSGLRWGNDYGYEDFSSPAPAGLQVGGQDVYNIFPYDQDGQPLTGVQLFDSQGQPLTPAAPNYADPNGNVIDLVPGVDAYGQQQFNVYPLRERNTGGGYDPQTGLPFPAPVSTPRDAARPRPSVPPLLPTASPAPSAASSPAPPAASSPAPPATTAPASGQDPSPRAATPTASPSPKS